jgi:hypothetical protein
MEEKILDPTEILIDRDGTIRTDTIRANPWLRFLGRMADYGLIGLVFYGIQKFFSFQIEFETLIPLQFVAWIPIEALLLSFWGKTPGKWLVGTQIERGGFHKLELRSSFRRAFFVWFRGIGMGIMVINFLCMLTAYYRLQVFKTTTWDLDEQIVVTHRPVANWRLAASFLLMLSSLFFK